MKKLLSLLFVLCFALQAGAQITNVTVGTAANDNTGDTMRSAFQKLNWNDNYGLTNDLSGRRITSQGSTTPRTLALRFAEVRNILDFGAEGNGTTDDTTAFQAAANAIPVLTNTGPFDGGGTLFIPRGVYKITSAISIRPGTKVIGAGRLASRIVNYSTNHALIYTDDGSGSAANPVIKDLTIDGSGVSSRTSGSGIVVLWGREITIENVEMWYNYNGLVLSNAQVATIKDSKARNNVLDGFQTVGTCNALSFVGCYASNNGRHGYSVLNSTYTSFFGCASDANGGAGYASITSSQNVSFFGCGTEMCNIGYFSENARNLSMFSCYSVLTTNDAVRLDGVRQASLVNVNAGNTVSGYGLNIRTSTNSTTSYPVVTTQCTFTGGTGTVNDLTKIIAIGRIGTSGTAGDGIGVWDNAASDVPYVATIAGAQTNFVRLTKTSIGTWEFNITGADLGVFSGSTRVLNLDDLAPVNALDVGQSAVTVNNPLVGSSTLDITGNTVLRSSLHRVGGTAVDSRFAYYLTPSVGGDGSQGVGLRIAPVMSTTQTSNADAVYISHNATAAQPLSRGILIDNPSGTITNNVGLAILGQTRGSTANTDLLIGAGTPAPGNYSLYNASSNPSQFDGAVRFGTGTADRATYLDSNKALATSATTATELGYVSGVTSAIQTQINGKQDAFTTSTGVTNTANVLSANIEPGTNVSFTTNANGRITITGTTPSSNWTADGTTNSTLAGEARVHILTATNSIVVGGTNITGAIAGKEPLLVNSAGLRAALSDETGSGAAVFGTSPSIATPSITGSITLDSDAIMVRDAANTLALRNGTAAQTFHIYNTYTDASNYERAFVGVTGNVFWLTTQEAGTGVNRAIRIGPAGEWQFNTSGHFIATTDNAVDIGASGANRPRNVYVGTSVVSPAVYVTNAAQTATLYINGIDQRKKEIGGACSDETTALTTGTAKLTFRMPYKMSVTAVRANLSTAQASGSIFTVDVNESGTTILSTKLTIDNTEKTSTTAATAAVISDTTLADDSEITIDIDQIGDSTAKGLKIWIIGNEIP